MNRVILLTATVQPSIIGKGVWTREDRKKEYLNAIHFYLSDVNIPVVIVDNSGYDFADDILVPNRLESLCFQGEDVGQGKGWGECSILKYALANSSFLKNADQIVKITGRLIIRNINEVLKTCNSINSVYADADLQLSYPHSYFFCCPKIFLLNELFPRHHLMNDSAGVHFEHVLGAAIKAWRSYYPYHEFRIPLHIEGHPGDSTIKYKKPSRKRHILIWLKYHINEIINKCLGREKREGH